MKKILALALLASLISGRALADWTGKDATPATITFKNPGVCTSVACVPVAQLYDGTNVVTLTTAGGDAAANAIVGVPVYSRNVLWNGTTWDRWTGDLTSGGWVNIKASVLPTGGATSANQTSQITQETATAAALGTTTDAVGSTPSTGSAATLIALAKAINNNVSSAIPAGSNIIGKVGIDQTTPGTTNLVALAANQSVNNAQINGVTPLMGNGQTGTGAQRITLSQDGASAPINVSTATDTQIVALSGSTVIYITSFDVVAGGTGNITFEYGTGSNCATGKTALTGAYPLTAQAGIAKGSGVGTILKVPAGNALCVLTSAAVQMSGSVSYIQF